MKKVDMIKENFINMKTEYIVNHHKTCRKIDNVFNDEIKHFKNLFFDFNNEYKCLSNEEIYIVSDKVKDIFNSCKVILVDNYQQRFDRNMEEIVSTMYDFFIRSLDNPSVKPPTKEVNKCLVDMCKFDCFVIEDKLENELIDFANDFIYRYINSDDEQRDFVYIVKNINYSLMCELKKAIAVSTEDKQDITTRYNTMNKEIVKPYNEGR